MDRNAYQSELDQVQFTEAGRSALTDALMAEQAGPPVQHRSLVDETGMAAVLARAVGGHGGGCYCVAMGQLFRQTGPGGAGGGGHPQRRPAGVRSPQAEP